MEVGKAVRGMCSLNQVSPGAETERNTSSSREGEGVLKQTGSSVSTSSTSYLLGNSGGDATGCSPGLQVQGVESLMPLLQTLQSFDGLSGTRQRRKMPTAVSDLVFIKKLFPIVA